MPSHVFSFWKMLFVLTLRYLYPPPWPTHPRDYIPYVNTPPRDFTLSINHVLRNLRYTQIIPTHMTISFQAAPPYQQVCPSPIDAVISQTNSKWCTNRYMAGCNLAHDIKHGNRTEWNFGDSKFPQYKDSRTTRRCLRPEPFSDKPPTKTHPALKLSPTVNGLKAATRSRSDSLEYCASSTTARRMLGKFLCAIGCWLKRWWMPKHSTHPYVPLLPLLFCLLLSLI